MHVDTSRQMLGLAEHLVSQTHTHTHITPRPRYQCAWQRSHAARAMTANTAWSHTSKLPDYITTTCFSV